MSIQVDWHNDIQTAITICYQQPWDWAEFEAAREQLLILLDSLQHPVDLILDVRKAGPPPEGAILRFRKTLQTDHPNTRQVIFVGEQYLITSFLDIIFHIYGRFLPESRLRFVNSLEEAELLISDGRESVQDTLDA